MKTEAQEIVVQLGTTNPGRPLRIVTIVEPAPRYNYEPGAAQAARVLF